MSEIKATIPPDLLFTPFGKGFFARLSKKRIDEDGNKLLLEEDFEY